MMWQCIRERETEKIYLSNNTAAGSVVTNTAIEAVVKVRGNAGERRSWAPYNCWRAFPGPPQPLMIKAR